MTYTATYSPEDNKLRLYAFARLDADLYKRVRAAGFIWAPKQELFVAPAWSPERADLLTELAGDIDDEDRSLVDRAEERADRFADYSESRADDAERARAAVDAIAGNIPMGQPILIGHHSEKHARKDAERIENGMRKAVKMWETSKYWKQRAAGALAHAKYKEVPAVRARRIKGLEADIRSYRAKFTPDSSHVIMQEPWNASDGVKVPHVFCAPKGGRGGSWVQVSRLPELEAHYTRWITHCELRLEYERAMLGESGGLAADKFNIEVGGRVLVRGEWVVVLRINRKDGAITSVSTTRKYVSKVDIENVSDYRAPSAEDSAKVKAAVKLAPLCNYPGEGFKHILKADWDRKHADYKSSRTIPETETIARHRVRYMTFYPTLTPVYLTDVKLVEPPKATAKAEPVTLPPNERALPDREYDYSKQAWVDKKADAFDAMRESLKHGVKTVSAPQLFPTPGGIARRMVELAKIQDGHRILEPSAGTGNIVWAIARTHSTEKSELTAVEFNCSLADSLARSFQDVHVKQADFLQCNGDLGKFDRILMNPPFENAADIKHIQHAVKMLKPGGRLVAICANGPRQNDILKPLVDSHGGEWEELPADTFKASGTGVRTVLLTLQTAA